MREGEEGRNLAALWRDEGSLGTRSDLPPSTVVSVRSETRSITIGTDGMARWLSYTCECREDINSRNIEGYANGTQNR